MKTQGYKVHIDSSDKIHQGSHRDWKTWKPWKMKVIMEKSCNMKSWSKVMEFVDKSTIPMLPLDLTKCVPFLLTLRNIA